MPSPFPGMDPYLEHPAIFPDLHDRMIVSLSESVNGRLPESYFARIGSRVWVEVSQRPIAPDVNVLRRERDANGGIRGAGGGVAVAPEAGTKPVVVYVPHDETRENFLNIYKRLGNEILVTTIEVLSLANKMPGAHGRDLYLRKQTEILESRTHLVEIDLLRGGTHTTAVPRERAVAQTGPFDYHVCIHRFDAWENFLVYPIRLDQRLPEIAIPLLPEDGVVPTDLQAVFDRCYDNGLYLRQFAYGEITPEPPLHPEQQE
jgi:hypothetical protein